MNNSILITREPYLFYLFITARQYHIRRFALKLINKSAICFKNSYYPTISESKLETLSIKLLWHLQVSRLLKIVA